MTGSLNVQNAGQIVFQCCSAHTVVAAWSSSVTESARERLNVLRNILRRWILQFFKIYLCFPAEFQQQDGSKEWGFPTMILSLIVTFIIINFGVFFLRVLTLHLHIRKMYVNGQKELIQTVLLLAWKVSLKTSIMSHNISLNLELQRLID